MPRFSTAFYRRKSTADDLTAVQPSPESPSFRVLERHPSPPPRAFDGGARMARTSGVPMHKPSPSELDVEDNIFAGLNNNRGSGASNTTKATSTDNSSRHSNASTAPSSADMANTQDDRGGKRKPAGQETMPRPLTKSSTSSFLDRAGRTFSFGIKNKHHTPPPKQEDVPPLPTFQREDEYGRTRAMTASTTSTATPPKLEEESNFDLGGDFGSMFSKFDKRASVATLRMDGKQNPSPSPTKQRPQLPGPVPPPLDIGATKGPVDSAPPSWNSQNSYQSRETLMSPPQAAQYDQPPPVPRHQPSFEYRSVKSPGSPMEDEDARLLADSVAAGKFLTTEIPEHAAVERYRRDEDDFTVMGRGPGASDFSREDNMFAGTSSQFSRTTIREAPRPANASSDNPNSRVMTPAEFERYRRDKEREGLEKAAYGEPADDDDDEDPINYDDEEDEDDKLKQQAKQRRNQQAQMTAYRQRNMKTTGELATTTPISPSRPTLGTSLSAPHLAPNKTPSPEPGHAIDEDEDEDVPLAILQAHGFPNKGRAPSRLTSYGSNPNLRASMMLQPGRPASVVGDPASQKRFSTLPAFARGLPQDPFVGAGIARPAVRESMSFGIGSPQPPPQQSPPMHPGGLIGVIATEERNRAMRRGSPNLESQRAHFGGGMDPMMFNGGMRMPPQQQPPQNANQLSVQDQAQLQMSQQMSSFLQMQMQFMQMMAGQQPNGSPQMLQQMSPPMMQQQMMGSPPGQQQPYGGFAGSQSVADFQSGQSFGGSPPLTQPRRMDASMRTMSMIQPSSSSFMQPAFGNGMGPGAGYSPSIAPSERSNIGLPGRYRPVSQAGSLTGQNFMHQRTQSMSGATALSSFATPDDSKVVPTVKLVSEAKNSNNHSDDEDDEEGWAAMKAKREQKKSRWRLKKGSTDLF